MKLYSLTAAGKKAKFKGTRAAAALEALKGLGGEASSALSSALPTFPPMLANADFCDMFHP
jgi:hypothetical protein